MKRWICVVTALLLMTLAFTAGAETLPLDVIDRLAGELPQLLGNEAYADIFTGAWTMDFDAAIEALAQNAWQHPSHTVYLGCDDLRLLTELGAPESAVEAMRPYLVTAIVTLVRDDASYDAMLLNRIGQNSDFFVDADMPDGAIVFLRFYEDGPPLIGVAAANNGAVSVSVGVVSGADDLSLCRTASDVQAWLDARGMAYILASETPVMLPVSAVDTAGDAEPARAASLARICAGQMSDAAWLQARGAADAGVNPVDADLYDSLRLAVYMELDLHTQGMVCFGGSVPVALASDDGPVERRLSLNLPNTYMLHLVSNYGGVVEILTMSTSMVETLYADPERADGTGAYLFFYEGGGAAVVNFLARDGVVCMNAMLTPLDGLSGCQSATDVSLWLARRTVPAVCTEVNVE
ncbi:MAG: hypothetical protein IKK57_01390 [Clostridia bacterium]|nr:hypothetical protein [Clostridia bacterium]